MIDGCALCMSTIHIGEPITIYHGREYHSGCFTDLENQLFKTWNFDRPGVFTEAMYG